MATRQKRPREEGSGIPDGGTLPGKDKKHRATRRASRPGPGLETGPGPEAGQAAQPPLAALLHLRPLRNWRPDPASEAAEKTFLQNVLAEAQCKLLALQSAPADGMPADATHRAIALMAELEEGARLDLQELDERDEANRCLESQVDHLIAQVLSAPALRFDQTRLDWDTGNGICAALCIEYAECRIAGILPALILPDMRRRSARPRLLAAQAATRRTCGTIKALCGDFKQAKAGGTWPRARLETAWRKIRSDTFSDHDSAHDVIADALRAGPAPLPAKAAPARFREISRIKTDFSLEALGAAWATPYWIPEILPFLPRALRHKGIPVQMDGDPAPAPNIDYAQACLAAQRMERNARIDFGWHTWAGHIGALVRHLARRPAHPMLLLSLLYKSRKGNHRSHDIVLDLSRECSGIFDPNCGVVPLPSTRVDDPYCVWLLAAFAVAYRAHTMRCMELAGQELPARDLPTLLPE